MPPALIELAIGLVLVVVGVADARRRLRRGDWSRQPPPRWTRFLLPRLHISVSRSRAFWLPQRPLPHQMEESDARAVRRVLAFRRVLYDVALAVAGTALTIHALTQLG